MSLTSTKRKKSLLLLSRYDALGASSRLRAYQYLPYLADNWNVLVAPFFRNAYLHALYKGRHSLKEIAHSYVDRVRILRRSGQFDLVWIEIELFPWLPWEIESALMQAGVPYVVDYDDAVFHRYNNHRLLIVRRLLGRKIAKVMQHARVVMVGNKYIATYAHQAGAQRVEYVPTVVDLARYTHERRPYEQNLTIGWIGTPITQHYLQVVAPTLEFAHRDLGARIVAIGASGKPLSNVPIEIRAWDQGTEAAELQRIAIGIMPLLDSPWERGKCGYKLIQYMAAGIPVVASPVGVNAEIVEHGVTGFLASTQEEWIHYLTILARDPHLRARMGTAGRRRVETSYCTKVVAPKLQDLLLSATEFGRA